jgi:DNA-directed RNA polymerase specialized sigma24 family protein
MSGGRPWTTTEARKLQELRAQRTKTKDIAKLLGRTEDAVHSFLHYVPVGRTSKPHFRRLNQRINGWTEAEDQRLRDLAECGVLYREIGRVLGRSHGAVMSRAFKLGVTRAWPGEME